MSWDLGNGLLAGKLLNPRGLLAETMGGRIGRGAFDAVGHAHDMFGVLSQDGLFQFLKVGIEP